MDPGFTKSTGHFSQVVWRRTKEVGMGAAVGDDGRMYVVARYYPRAHLGSFRHNVLPLKTVKGPCADDTPPCKNGGLCLTQFNSSAKPDYLCQCPSDFYGINCERVSPCKMNSSLCNSGFCVPRRRGMDYECYCWPGKAYGAHCEIENPCKKNGSLCKNGGNCLFVKSSKPYYRCKCPYNRSGIHCEKGCKDHYPPPVCKILRKHNVCKGRQNKCPVTCGTC